jgi:hypothetical protein
VSGAGEEYDAPEIDSNRKFGWEFNFKEAEMRKVLSLAVICLLGTLVFAANEPLNVKTGLWQVTETSAASGVPAIPADMQARLDKMTPEQRAQVEAAINSRLGGTPQTINYKSCVTKEDLNKNAFNGSNEKCTWTVVSSTGSDMEAQGTSCAAGKDQGMKTDVKMKLHVIDSENVKATVQGTSTGDGRTVNVNAAFTGKWIGATCPTDTN